MELQLVHAFYRGKEGEHDFLPGWGYDIRLHQEGNNVTIHRFDNEAWQPWKTVTVEAFSQEWRIKARK